MVRVCRACAVRAAEFFSSLFSQMYGAGVGVAEAGERNAGGVTAGKRSAAVSVSVSGARASQAGT